MIQLVPALLGALFLTTTLPGCTGEGEAPPDVEPAAADAAPTPAPEQEVVDLARIGFNEGDEDQAVIFVVEFSDFGCVFCARFHEETYPDLEREFVDGGDVAWKYVPVTIGGFPNGELAALAGECAGAQTRFPVMRDHLFERREEWMAVDQDEIEGRLVGYAGALGLDADAFRECLAGERAAARVAASNRIARQLGVRATPTFLVNGEPVEGAVPLDAFRDAFRRLIPQLRDPGGP
jgi:protein-disulfide isomerase